jgi:curved DNA-binding protein CbpA
MARRLALLLLAVRSALCDHYATLGVSPRASEKELTKAYREQAKLYHPDKNKAPGAEEQFQKVADAYETLGDSRMRHAYDAQQREERMYGGARRGFQQQQQHYHHRQQQRPQRFMRVYRNGRVYTVPVDDGDEAFFFHQQQQRQSQHHVEEMDLLMQILPALIVGFCFAVLGLTYFWQDDDATAPAARYDAHRTDARQTDARETDRRPSENDQTAPAPPIAVDSASSIRDLVAEAKRRRLNVEGCAEKSDLLNLLGVPRHP